MRPAGTPSDEVAAQYTAAGMDPSAGRLDGADIPPGAGLVRYKHCGPYLVALELCPDSRTNEGRAAMAADPDHVPCRADKARTLWIEHVLTGGRVAEVASSLKGETVYRAGEVVEAVGFWPVYGEQCCPGIHYFRSLNAVYGRMIQHGAASADQLRERLGGGTRAILRDSEGLLVFDRLL